MLTEVPAIQLVSKVDSTDVKFDIIDQRTGHFQRRVIASIANEDLAYLVDQDFGFTITDQGDIPSVFGRASISLRPGDVAYVANIRGPSGSLQAGMREMPPHCYIQWIKIEILPLVGMLRALMSVDDKDFSLVSNEESALKILQKRVQQALVLDK